MRQPTAQRRSVAPRVKVEVEDMVSLCHRSRASLKARQLPGGLAAGEGEPAEVRGLCRVMQ